jgi:hypothetical protein
MKKLLLTLGLAALTLASAHAQGTINPLNGALTRVRFDSNNDGVIDPTDQNVDASKGLTVGVFWGAAGSSPVNFAGNMTIGSTAGVLVGLPTIFAIPGAGDVGTVISLQMRVTSPGYCGQTEVKQVTLAPAAGPGTVVWSSTATASRFGPLVINCPEPSTLALGALAGALLLFRLRKTTNAN